MTELHPITPSPKLIEEWIELSRPRKDRSPNPNVLATYAARWGADQELEACINAILEHPGFENPELFVELLRAARRPSPKPPSLKAQALAVVENSEICDHVSIEQAAILRRALEALPE